jgi:sugar phosphate isomerase/epimerase
LESAVSSSGNNPAPLDEPLTPPPAAAEIGPIRLPVENPPWNFWDIVRLVIVAIFAIGDFGVLAVARALHYLGPQPEAELARDPRIIVPAQFAAYLVLFVAMVVLVRLRGFAFWRHGPLEEVKDGVVRHLKEAARIVEGEGAVLAMENEYSTCNNNVARTLELIEAVGSPNLKLLYDPGNDVHDQEGEVACPDSYDLARGRFVHMHLKDPARDPQTGEVSTKAIGEGDVCIEPLMRAIIADGYSGYISLETHYRREPMAHEIQRLPVGDSFSAGGYVASRECLEKWFAILRRITGETA